MNDRADLTAYEGLVGKTTLMFAAQVGLDPEDMRQELWVKIIKARRSYSTSRSRMTERAFVYACMANFVKDLKRDAARRAAGRLEISHIEDFMANGEGFELRYRHATHDEVYGPIDDGSFTMPATVTPDEQEIIFLLVLGYAQTEIALQLGIEYGEVVKSMRQLRQKLADWKPGSVATVESGRTAERIAA